MKKIIIISVIAIMTIFISAATFFTWIVLTDDPLIPPDLPIKSKPGKILITSNGCCMWVENFKVKAVNDHGAEMTIAEVPKIMVYDIYNFKLPVLNDMYSDIAISCTYYYGNYYEFNEIVFTIEKIKQKGLLFYVQEIDGAYFNAITGDNHISYKLNWDTESWDKLDIPTKIYK